MQNITAVLEEAASADCMARLVVESVGSGFTVSLSVDGGLLHNGTTDVPLTTTSEELAQALEQLDALCSGSEQAYVI